ncbi:sensor histidine kinase [Paenibacillus alkalitolerans]|uniref:sensor histidine kinase n=1 Tax=Paenibacillus alkalitolerans TaxID=2799335 RepID=UPI0018F6B61F|nr:ATP-binding protein [Paenibacillus alkalitolerans]
MKLRAYLLIANAVSIGIILVSLFVCYRFMLLKLNETLLLTSVTLGAAIVSFAVHFAMTRPLESSIRKLTNETARVAEGRFDGTVPLAGPEEFRRLAEQFNRMSGMLRESFDRLRTTEASRRELVANVSHDLRTPMASIQAFVEALQDEVIQDKETFGSYLRTIRLETQRLNRLIDTLFELSQLQSGAYVFTPERCHADNLLLETLQSHVIKLEEKNIDIQAHVQENLPPLLVMPFEIKRVLANLLENAIRHSPPGGSISIMAAELPEESGFVQISIIDQGEGIDSHDREKIFDRFYRADPSRSRGSGGAGLGLAIAKSIVELHGGRIGVEGGTGEGSRFWFTVRCV